MLDLAERLAALNDQQWNSPSLCAQWRIRDVLAHVTAGAEGAFGVGAIVRGCFATASTTTDGWQLMGRHAVSGTQAPSAGPSGRRCPPQAPRGRSVSRPDACPHPWSGHLSTSRHQTRSARGASRSGGGLRQGRRSYIRCQEAHRWVEAHGHRHGLVSRRRTRGHGSSGGIGDDDGRALGCAR